MSTRVGLPEYGVDTGKRGDGAHKAAAPAPPPVAERDPVASYMKKTRGKLGADHRLDF